MNITFLKHKIVDALRPRPLPASSIFEKCGGSRWGQYRTLRNLVANGVIEIVPASVKGPRGWSVKLYRLVDDTAFLPQETKLRKRSRIFEVIGTEEVTGGEIARRLGLEHSNISGKLLQLCASGKLVRRKQFGEIRGRATAREFYLYRRPVT